MKGIFFSYETFSVSSLDRDKKNSLSIDTSTGSEFSTPLDNDGIT